MSSTTSTTTAGSTLSTTVTDTTTLTSTVTVADNVTTTAAANVIIVKPTTDEVIPDVIVTFMLIAGCALLAILVAKGADYIYDQHIKKETEKKAEAQERTKNLLTARGVVMTFSSEPKDPPMRAAKSAARKWMRKASKTSSVVTINELSPDTKVMGNGGIANGDASGDGTQWAEKVGGPENGSTELRSVSKTVEEGGVKEVDGASSNHSNHSGRELPPIVAPVTLSTRNTLAPPCPVSPGSGKKLPQIGDTAKK